MNTFEPLVVKTNEAPRLWSRLKVILFICAPSAVESRMVPVLSPPSMQPSGNSHSEDRQSSRDIEFSEYSATTPSMIESFHTLRAELRFEPEKTKGSRHIATVVPIQSEEEVRGILERVAAELPRANHHAYAWRLARIIHEA